MTYIKLMMVVIIFYLELTIGEVLIHKYVMHNNPNSIMRKIYGDYHIRHHMDVKSDMTLSDNYFEEGLFFGWKYTLLLSILIFSIWYPTLHLFFTKINRNYIFGLSILMGITYKLLWDYLHYSFHQLSELESKRSNPIFNWLFINHTIHHLQKGERKGNYNIIFPGGDFILGSYNSCINNKKSCTEKDQSDIMKTMCYYENNQIPLKHGIKWCN